MNRFKQIEESIVSFRDERDWKKFHNPKDLAISLSIEAGELLECFQWKTNDEIDEILKSDKRVEIEDEVADVANYLILLCNELNIDIFEAIERKIKKNSLKYPVSMCKGSSKKYNEYEEK
ncbi:nucleotide pyrophosphohydrolase [Romboutsia weinsteinii]|uniref:Nucleotide pyrophosphohydrolase n=1 Tax=Romboutsia weinsteinii TaxID=2020949 RepID=A0A371IZD2_9FIRM|nr:nucleotide pyrophosphohydrolase [Romboutsia weinsteinii]RDY25839.1 nucleotide pyrophosphohydrolase [Romboutsia weinsteinii]